MWTSGYGTAIYTPPNDNGIFALNGTAWLVGQVSSPPPTVSGVPVQPRDLILMGLGLAVAAMLQMRKRLTLLGIDGE
jgi:hypothetical protein